MINININDFIEKNNLSLKSQDEIVQKTKAQEFVGGLFNFRPEVLVSVLTYENAKQFLTEEAIQKYNSGEEKWEYFETLEAAAKDFLEYMEFAWGKAEDCRGLSASRSIQKIEIYLWLLNREDLAKEMDSKDYNPYGAPMLIHVCDKMEIPVPHSLREFATHKV